MFKKNEETGDFELVSASYVEMQDEKRKPFVKTPLPAKRLSFFDWLASVFRFRRDPFRASAIAREIGRRERIEHSCIEAKELGQVASPDQDPVTSINVRLNEYVDRAMVRTDKVTDELDKDMNLKEQFLNKCRPDLMKDGLLDELGKIKSNLPLDMGPLAKVRADDVVKLEEFRSHHGLRKTIHWGKEVSTAAVLIIMIIVLLEFVLNTVFFAGADPRGFVGAAMTALLLSIGTIFLGVALGLSFQLSHPNSGGKLVGRTLFGLFMFAALYYLLLLTCARLAGENGELKMFAAAAAMIQTHPFSGLLDLPSLAYVFFSIAIIFGVACEYLYIMGRFPGLRSIVLAAQASDENFDAQVAKLVEDSKKVGEGEIECLNNLPTFISGGGLKIKEITMEYENVVDQFKSDIKAIDAAAKILLGHVNSKIGRGGQPIDTLRVSDQDGIVETVGGKLTDIRCRAAALLNRDGIRPEEVDRCRDDMTEAVQVHLQEVSDQADAIKKHHYDERRHGHREESAKVTVLPGASVRAA